MPSRCRARVIGPRCTYRLFAGEEIICRASGKEMGETTVFSIRQKFLNTFGRKSRQGVREVLVYYFRPLLSTEPRELQCSKGARMCQSRWSREI